MGAGAAAAADDVGEAGVAGAAAAVGDVGGGGSRRAVRAARRSPAIWSCNAIDSTLQTRTTPHTQHPGCQGTTLAEQQMVCVTGYEHA